MQNIQRISLRNSLKEAYRNLEIKIIIMILIEVQLFRTHYQAINHQLKSKKKQNQINDLKGVMFQILRKW